MPNILHINRSTGDITLGQLDASRLLSTDGSSVVSTTSLSSWVTGTANQISVADDGDGTITLDLEDEVTVATSLTVPTIYGGSGSGDDLIIDSTSNATKGVLTLQTEEGAVQIGSSSSSLEFPTQVAVVGDGTSTKKPGTSYYFTTDNYPALTYYMTNHGNIQQWWNMYWDSDNSKTRISSEGGVFRWIYEYYAGGKAFDLQYYDGAGLSGGDEFSSALIESAFRIDLDDGQIQVNSSQHTYPFVVMGDTDTDLLFVDTDNNKVGVGKTPSAKLDVDGSIAGDSLTLNNADNCLQAGPWSDVPDPILAHNNITGYLFLGFTSDSAGYGAYTPGRLMLFANLGNGGMAYNYYWDGDSEERMDTSRSSWYMNLSGVNDNFQIKYAAADTGSIASWDIPFHIDGSNLRVGINETSPNASLDVNGTTRLGDSDTNYIAISATGDVSFTGSAGFYPVRLSQSAQPTPDTGEMVVWRDPDDNKTYIVYNDTDEGVRKVEMT